MKIKDLEVEIKRKNIKHIYLRIKNDKVEVSCNNFISKDFIKEFVLKHYEKIKKQIRTRKDKDFYKQNAPKIILPIVKKYSKLMGLFPSKISFRFKISNWGSCTSKNHIIFNYYLIDEDKEFIEYVVVHELAHIKFKHHKKEFWELVERFFPNYKKVRE